jgi:predicted transcriptional regulator
MNNYIEVEDDLNKLLDEKANQKGITKSELIRRALDVYIEMSLYEAETPKDLALKKDALIITRITELKNIITDVYRISNKNMKEMHRLWNLLSCVLKML